MIYMFIFSLFVFLCHSLSPLPLFYNHKLITNHSVCIFFSFQSLFYVSSSITDYE